MSMSDPIADMLIRIRNAFKAKHDVVEMFFSKLKVEIARILKREGYITDYVVEGGGQKKTLRLYLKYQSDHESAIRGVKRMSKPGLRRYVSAKKMPRTLRGMGIVILSTPAGVMTDSEARKRKVGGEVLCEVW